MVPPGVDRQHELEERRRDAQGGPKGAPVVAAALGILEADLARDVQAHEGVQGVARVPARLDAQVGVVDDFLAGPRREAPLHSRRADVEDTPHAEDPVLGFAEEQCVRLVVAQLVVDLMARLVLRGGGGTVAYEILKGPANQRCIQATPKVIGKLGLCRV